MDETPPSCPTPARHPDRQGKASRRRQNRRSGSPPWGTGTARSPWQTASGPPRERDPLERLDARVLLRAGRELFRETIIRPPGPLPSPRLILGWMAHAYVHRGELRNPSRVIYTNLKHGEVPRDCYLDDPCRYLPGSFLSSLGLEAPPDLYSQYLEDAYAEEPAEELPPEPPVPGADLLTNGPGSRLARQAWQELRELLREELPTPVFRQRVEGLRLAGFDPVPCRFTLTVPQGNGEAASPDAVAQTAAQLGVIMERRLMGICSRRVEVEFINQ